MEEVGRQAAIFKKADQVFLWIGLSSDDIRKYLRGLHCFAMVLHEKAFSSDSDKFRVEDLPWLLKEITNLHNLVDDPWFTSLWTLEEAYLRKDAIFLSRDGQIVDTAEFKSFQDLLTCCTSIYTSTRTIIEIDDDDGKQRFGSTFAFHLKRLLFTLDEVGLPALATPNPVSLYSASTRRQATQSLDRIYGIMQIYGLKLGESVEPEKSFTLEDLELQLGMALNTKCPVLAQAFTHPDNLGRAGRTWLLTEYIEVPENFYKDGDVIENLCRIEFQGSSNKASFAGSCCSFSKLSAYWKTEPSTSHGDEVTSGRETSDRSMQKIYIDSMRYGYADIVPESLRSTKLPRDARQHELCDVLEAFWMGDVSVLLLGRVKEPSHDGGDGCGNWVGLLIEHTTKHDRFQGWRRVGVCIWDILKTDPNFETNPLWRRTEDVLV